MNALILGSGAREHAIAWKLSRSTEINKLYIAPGNAGTNEIGVNIPELDPLDFSAVRKACSTHRIDFVFVGPEDPLVGGVVDYLEQEKIHAVGPHKQAAQLEASKCYSKKFMLEHGIPTGYAEEFTDENKFAAFVNKKQEPLVVKKNGLAAGKGVLVSDDNDALISFGKEVLKSDSLLVEEYLEGYELSVFAVSDGEHVALLPPCADYKRAFDGDDGPNTGGMGSICPVPQADAALMSQIEKEVVQTTFKALHMDGIHYRGVLYFGLMITQNGPKLLEYNVRLGDPESQVLLPVLDTDLGKMSTAILNGTVNSSHGKSSGRHAVTVVVAAAGYPGTYKKGLVVEPIPDFPESEVLIFHATTVTNERGETLTGGGRCFSVVGIGSDLASARQKSYDVIDRIKFDGAWYRSDIGMK